MAKDRCRGGRDRDGSVWEEFLPPESSRKQPTRQEARAQRVKAAGPRPREGGGLGLRGGNRGALGKGRRTRQRKAA